MHAAMADVDVDVKCPYCGGGAYYRYGKAWTGKQRFLCLLCNKQFTMGTPRTRFKQRPLCPACGMPMHIYRREDGFVRFRCSNYPNCRTFRKVDIESLENGDSH